MVVIMRPGTAQQEIDKLARQLQSQGLQVGITKGVDCSILGLVGDTTSVDLNKISTSGPIGSSTPRIPPSRWGTPLSGRENSP